MVDLPYVDPALRLHERIRESFVYNFGEILERDFFNNFERQVIKEYHFFGRRGVIEYCGRILSMHHYTDEAAAESWYNKAEHLFAEYALEWARGRQVEESLRRQAGPGP